MMYSAPRPSTSPLPLPKAHLPHRLGHNCCASSLLQAYAIKLTFVNIALYVWTHVHESGCPHAVVVVIVVGVVVVVVVVAAVLAVAAAVVVAAVAAAAVALALPCAGELALEPATGARVLAYVVGPQHQWPHKPSSSAPSAH